jgi:hypothetical protein
MMGSRLPPLSPPIYLFDALAAPLRTQCAAQHTLEVGTGNLLGNMGTTGNTRNIATGKTHWEHGNTKLEVLGNPMGTWEHGNMGIDEVADLGTPIGKQNHCRHRVPLTVIPLSQQLDLDQFRSIFREASPLGPRGV